MTDDDSTNSPDRLKQAWEARARSPYREFYIASHRGWDDDQRVEHQARFDTAIVLRDFDDETLAAMDVLEIGCGSGRLAAQIAPRVRSYTGFDIAPTMVEVAEQRLAGRKNVTVLVGDGSGVPAAVSQGSYGLVFSHAVLIHCPREVIARYVRDCWPLVAAAGRMRLQLLADAGDPTGIEPPEQIPQLDVAPPQEDAAALSDDEQRDLSSIEDELDGTYYMGHRFRYDDVRPFLEELAPDAQIEVRRFEGEHIYVEMTRER